MSARRWKSVTQVPPELPLGLGRSGTHCAGEATLRRHDRAIALGPDSCLVACGHVLTTTPTPNPSPQGGGEHTEFAACSCSFQRTMLALRPRGQKAAPFHPHSAGVGGWTRLASSRRQWGRLRAGWGVPAV